MISRMIRIVLPILGAAVTASVIIIVLTIAGVISIGISPPSAHFKGVVTYISSPVPVDLDHTLSASAYGRFQVIVNASTTVNCFISANRNATHNGTCSSFLYVYKTRSSIQFDAKAKIEARFHANATTTSVKVQITGELDPLTQQMGWSMTSQTNTSIETQLDSAVTSSLTNVAFK